MAKENAQADIADLVNGAQALLRVGTVGAPQFENLLRVEKSILSEAETFSRHWFERRHEATDTAIKAVREMNSAAAGDPSAAMQAVIAWHRGSFQRVNADLQEWIKLCMRCAGAATTAQLDTDQGGARQAEGKASSKPQAGHATPV